jgi:hypothetical protein
MIFVRRLGWGYTRSTCLFPAAAASLRFSISAFVLGNRGVLMIIALGRDLTGEGSS